MVSENRRRKILLVAYACRPGLTSEREVGWRWASLISQQHDVIVLTRETNRPYIESWLALHPSSRQPTFLYYDLPSWCRAWKAGERGLYLYYAFWSLLAILKARSAHKVERFDITHFLTFGTLLWPQFAFLMNTRYVLGPVGGGERIPYGLRHAFGFKGRIKLAARRLAQWSLYVNPVFWLNVLLADRILVRTRETLDVLPAFVRPKSELFLETAVSLAVETPRESTELDELVIVTVGRLIPTKVSRLTLEAVRDFKKNYRKPFKFLIVGDGPEREHLENAARELGLEEAIFTGWCAAPEVLAYLRQSHIYFSTTMKEGGTWAFFEAIACRLPIVCLRVNGPDMIVGDGCGIKVSPDNYAAARQELARGLISLAESFDEREAYAAKALRYVQDNFTWERVFQRIDGIYASLFMTSPRRRESES